MKPILLHSFLATAAMIVLACRRGAAAAPAPTVEALVPLCAVHAPQRDPATGRVRAETRWQLCRRSGRKIEAAGTWRASPNGVFTMTL